MNSASAMADWLVLLMLLVDLSVDGWTAHARAGFDTDGNNTVTRVLKGVLQKRWTWWRLHHAL
jgi:hypothetical protein